jgi:8-oxo-dGTP pyrophosphatase MutT (NUDIX family)
MTSRFEIIEGHKLRKKVRAVIADESGRFLLIQPHGYADGNWTLVGGGVEDGETDWHAILREIREETGITAVLNLQMSKEQHSFRFSERIKRERQLDHDGQIATIFYVVVLTGAAVQAQEAEIQAYRWADFDQIDQLIQNAEQRNLFFRTVSEFSPQMDAPAITNG